MNTDVARRRRLVLWYISRHHSRLSEALDPGNRSSGLSPGPAPGNVKIHRHTAAGSAPITRPGRVSSGPTPHTIESIRPGASGELAAAAIDDRLPGCNGPCTVRAATGQTPTVAEHRRSITVFSPVDWTVRDSAIHAGRLVGRWPADTDYDALLGRAVRRWPPEVSRATLSLHCARGGGAGTTGQGNDKEAGGGSSWSWSSVT